MKKMKNIIPIVFIVLLTVISNGFANSSDKPLSANTFIDISKKCLPSVVSIRVKKSIEPYIQFKQKDEQGENDENLERGEGEDNLDELFRRFFMPFPYDKKDFPRNYEYSAAGSGLIIRADGYILTNNHVVSQVKEGNIEVKLNDDKVFEGDKVKIISTDSLTDLAVLKIEADNLPAAEWGDSDKVEIGEWVVALGNPLELNNSVTQGIISAKGREIQHAPIEDFFQTTAIINPGNSGGPLVNLDGFVIGINTAIASNTGYWQGIGFAIPSNVAKRVSESIIDKGRISRGYIGIMMDELRPDVAKLFDREPNTGIVVSQIHKNTPAEQAGIKVGDVIIEVEGTKIKDPASMVKAIANKEVGSKVNIKVLRYEDQKIEEKTFKLTLAERPAEDDLALLGTKEPKKQEFSSLGLQLEDIINLDGTKGPGIKVKGIKANSPAAESNLKRGDIIISVNNVIVNSVKEFEEAVAKRSAEKGFFIQYERNNVRSFTAISPEKKDDKKK